MKYFTKDLIIRTQVTDFEADVIWERNIKEYTKHIHGFKGILPDIVYTFFKGECLHDGRIISIKILNELGIREKAKKAWQKLELPTRIEIEIIHDWEPKIYTLNYNSVRKILYDFPSEEPLFFNYGDGMGVWLYDEISKIDDDFLKHEILFDSGTILSIEFKEFSYLTEVINE